MFGLGSASLDDYLTTERDLANRITRMPTKDYLLSKRETRTGESGQTNDVADEWENFEDELYDDFVML